MATNAFSMAAERQFVKAPDRQRNRKASPPGAVCVHVYNPMVGSPPMCAAGGYIYFYDENEDGAATAHEWRANGARATGLSVNDRTHPGSPAISANQVAKSFLGSPSLWWEDYGGGDVYAPFRYLHVRIEIETTPTFSNSDPGVVPWPSGPEGFDPYATRNWRWDVYYSPTEAIGIRTIIGWADFMGGQFYHGTRDLATGAWVVTPEGQGIIPNEVSNYLNFAVYEDVLMSGGHAEAQGYGTMSATTDIEQLADSHVLTCEGAVHIDSGHEGSGDFYTKIVVTKDGKYAMHPLSERDADDPSRVNGLWEVTKGWLDSFDLHSPNKVYSLYLRESETVYTLTDLEFEAGFTYVVYPIYYPITAGDREWACHKIALNDYDPLEQWVPPVIDVENSTPSATIVLPPPDSQIYWRPWRITGAGLQAGIVRSGIVQAESPGYTAGLNLHMCKFRFKEAGKSCQFPFLTNVGRESQNPNMDDGVAAFLSNAIAPAGCKSSYTSGAVYVEPDQFLYDAPVGEWRYGLKACTLQSFHFYWNYQPPGDPLPDTVVVTMPDFFLWPPCCLQKFKGTADSTQDKADDRSPIDL